MAWYSPPSAPRIGLVSRAPRLRRHLSRNLHVRPLSLHRSTGLWEQTLKDQSLGVCHADTYNESTSGEGLGLFSLAGPRMGGLWPVANGRPLSSPANCGRVGPRPHAQATVAMQSVKHGRPLCRYPKPHSSRPYKVLTHSRPWWAIYCSGCWASRRQLTELRSLASTSIRQTYSRCSFPWQATYIQLQYIVPEKTLGRQKSTPRNIRDPHGTADLPAFNSFRRWHFCLRFCTIQLIHSKELAFPVLMLRIGNLFISITQ